MEQFKRDIKSAIDKQVSAYKPTSGKTIAAMAKRMEALGKFMEGVNASTGPILRRATTLTDSEQQQLRQYAVKLAREAINKVKLK